jgi:hypothetical protein
MTPNARAATVALCFAFLVSGSARAQGAISGCVTDKFALPLVAPWIVVTGGATEILVLADNNGCYEVEKVPVGTYSVRAVLPGFCDEVRTDVKVVLNEHANVDFALKVANKVSVLPVVAGRWDWANPVAHADAIVHLRVDRFVNTKPYPSGRCDSDICTEYSATAIAIVKAPDSAGLTAGPLPLLWNSGLTTAGRAIDPGKEFVAFLAWSPTLKRLVLTERGLLVPVKDGAIVWTVGKDASQNGKKVNDFLTELRGLAGQK